MEKITNKIINSRQTKTIKIIVNIIITSKDNINLVNKIAKNTNKINIINITDDHFQN